MAGPQRAVPVRLARSLAGLLAVPLIAVVLGLLAIAAAFLALDGAAAIALIAAGAILAALGIGLAMVLLSIRLEITGSGLRVSSLLGSRDHALAPGPVTRLTLTGPDAVPLRARLGGRPWAFGDALLRGDERVWIVRLAPVDALVLVPTDRGRLAIAPRSERPLLEGLAELGRHVAIQEAPPVDIAEAPPDAPPAPPEPEPIPRLLTGIERSVVSELLEAARDEEARAALRAAEEAAAREAGEALAPVAVPTPEPRVKATAERRGWFRRRQRQAPASSDVEAAASGSLVGMASAAIPTVLPGEVELQAPEPELETPEPELQIPELEPQPFEREPEPELEPEPQAPAAQPEPWQPEPQAATPQPQPLQPEPRAAAPLRRIATSAAPAATAAPRRRRRSRLRRRIDRLMALPPASRVLGIMLIALPLGLAAAGWFVADRLGTLPETMEGRRSVALALLLLGPVTALAAVVARAATPRLVGLVLLSAAVGIVIVGRALMP